MEQQQRNEYELIQLLKLIAQPLDDVLAMNITSIKKYLKNIYSLGITELNETMNTHLVRVEGKKMSKSYITGLKKGKREDENLDLDLNYIIKNYPFVSAKIQQLMETEPPIFAEYSEKVPLDPFAGGRPAGGRPTTSEAVGDVFGRITPTGVSPRTGYKTSREVPAEKRPYDLYGEPTQMASAPPRERMDLGSKSEGKGILSKHKGVGIRMTGRGVAPKEKYIPLGKYLVNIHKLEHNNIVSFKSPNLKSTNIQSKRVSQPVADILLHIVNGTLDDIVTDNLSEDDISYLFQLIKKCELDNFLDGKAENKVKTKTEQEIHNFYVLQGEIVAGNDNPQIIREFKASLLTMMNEGKLSKKEAGDVLIQMALLGI